MSPLLFYSILLSTLLPPFASFPPLLSASSNDSHSPPPPTCHTFSPLLLPPPRFSASHLLTFSTGLQTLQVTFKKINLFLHPFPTAEPPSSSSPSSPLLISCSVFSHRHRLSIGPYSQSLIETAEKLKWLWSGTG